MDNRPNVSVCHFEKMGGYHSYSYNFEELHSRKDGSKLGLNFTLLAPIYEWRPWYYYTFNPPLVWKNAGSLVQIDIQSASCFLLLMFLSAATVYWSTRCLRRWFPSNTGFWTILWDFVASFFFEPFPSDSGVLSIRLVLTFWLLGITIFCNEVNGVFKGKLSIKVYAGVETEEDLEAFEYKLEVELGHMKLYGSYKYGERIGVMLTSYDAGYRSENNLIISKKSAEEKYYFLLLFLGKVESSPFKYDPRIHETIMNWALRLYEGSTGNNWEQDEFKGRLLNPLNKEAQLFTAYEMADLPVPFQLFGYGLAAAIAVKFLETILAFYQNRKQNRTRWSSP